MPRGQTTLQHLAQLLALSTQLRQALLLRQTQQAAEQAPNLREAFAAERQSQGGDQPWHMLQELASIAEFTNTFGDHEGHVARISAEQAALAEVERLLVRR